VTLIVDTLLAGTALLVAFLFRWDNSFLGPPMHQFLFSLPIVMGLHALASIVFRTFDSGWRWFGLRDTMALFYSATASSFSSIVFLRVFGLQDDWRSIILLYAFFVLAFTAGLRVFMRLLWNTLAAPVGARRAVVLGASGATELMVLVLRQSRQMNATPVAVIDPDQSVDRQRIHGVVTHYAGNNVVSLLHKFRTDLVVVPCGEELSYEHRRILEQCIAAGFLIEQLEVGMKAWKGEPIHTSGALHVVA
jgi:FlaA1/EpsC-like NDP-sugar epimerase